MRTARLFIVLALGFIQLASVGCGRDTALVRQAEATHARLLAAEGARTPAGGVGPILFFAPREEEAGAPAAVEGESPEAEMPASPAWEPIEGKSFGEILRADIREAPASVGRGFVHAFGKPENLLILGAAFGVDRIVRHNWDEDVREYFEDNDSSLAETDDFGSIIGNPALHFGVACAWYGIAVEKRDAKNHAFSKVMIEALAVNGLTTSLLKVSMNDQSPNGEYYGWPSGHMSSSMCFASVIHEYYGWPAAIPFYLLAGYSGASRLQDREHDLSDLVFGAALGWVVGHSVVKGELPQVGGFYVLPYADRGAGGLMFVKGF